MFKVQLPAAFNCLRRSIACGVQGSIACGVQGSIACGVQGFKCLKSLKSLKCLKCFVCMIYDLRFEAWYLLFGI
jgi:hypothetical protein